MKNINNFPISMHFWSISIFLRVTGCRHNIRHIHRTWHDKLVIIKPKLRSITVELQVLSTKRNKRKYSFFTSSSKYWNINKFFSV